MALVLAWKPALRSATTPAASGPGRAQSGEGRGKRGGERERGEQGEAAGVVAERSEARK